MKFLPRVIVCLFSFIICSSLFALTQYQQDYVDQIASGGPKGLKTAAQGIFNTNEQNPEILDVLAEKLLRDVNSVGGFGTIDAYAWTCRALGQSKNARYHDALQAVIDANVNKKLSSYAKKALKSVGNANVPQYTLGMAKLEDKVSKGVVVQEPTKKISQGTLSGLEISELGLINDVIFGGARGVLRTSKVLAAGKEVNPLVFDVLAEAMFQNIVNVKSRGEVEAYSWACNAIKTSANARYVGLIDFILSSKSNRKVKKYAKKAKKKLKKTSDEVYKQGQLNLNNLRQEIITWKKENNL